MGSSTGFLAGKRLLITGVLSNRSIAYGIARACKAQGAELAFSYVGERFKDRITEYAAEFGSDLVFECDVSDDASVKAAVDAASARFGRLDAAFNAAGINGDATRGERSAKELVYRVAHTIREAGERQGGYFASVEQADAFEAELALLLINQYAAFNSPVWFNCGLFQRYGIEGSGGNYAWSLEQQKVMRTDNAYEAPQCSACFIQKVDDDLMSIYELVKNEARLFKYGSGTGSNFSAIRGHQEMLSGGGTSSGLMSFLEVLDRAAGATKSGGTTRRARRWSASHGAPEIVDSSSGR